MLEGRVVRAAGGFFTVLAEDGLKYLCKARGNLKRGQAALLVGDRVSFRPEKNSSSLSDPQGIIEQKLPRRNFIDRPPVVNVDQLVIITSQKEPSGDWQLVSRLSVMAERENLQTVICVNKIDLLTQDEMKAMETLTWLYPYPLLYASAKLETGIDKLKAVLRGTCSVFAGPSGVGKSSLLNAVQPGLKLQTGEVSEKIMRGRHTTRHAELLALEGGGSVVDTPGFTRLDFQRIKPAELKAYFPEFETLQGRCAFRDCRHLTEPNCAVKDAVGQSVNPMRYEHYSYFAAEIGKGEEDYR